MKRRLILFLKIGIAVGLIAILVARGQIDFAELAKVGERWPWLLAAQLPFSIVLLVAAVRWRLLLRAQDIHYRLSDTYSLTLIGWVFNQMLLGTLGGDVVKAYVVAREQPGRRSAAVISVLVDRALGLFVLLFVALAGVLFNLGMVTANSDLIVLAWIVAGVFAATLVGAVLFFSARVRSLRLVRAAMSRLPGQDFFGRIQAAFYVYKFHLREVLLAVVLSVILHTSVVCTNLCLAFALLGTDIPWQSFFFLVPVAHVIMALPITPAALGTGEYAYEELFKLVGVSQGALICILQRVTFIFWALLGCFFYIQRRSKVEEAMDDARHAEEEEVLPAETETSTSAPT